MTTLPTGQRRYTRSYADFGTRPVELVPTDPRGDVYEGWMQVPLRLVRTKAHSNERIEFDQYVAGQLKRWIDYRAEHGWAANGLPKVSGPFEPPKPNAEAETPDWAVYIARAYFKPTHVILAGFTDVEELERQAALYGVDVWDARQTDSDAGMPTRSRINDVHTAPHDPMQFASVRRARLGLRRGDFLWNAKDFA